VIPYTIERRADTGVTNVTMGIWLFLASEVMLFGSLFSAYALLRTAAPAWPRGGDVLNVSMGVANTVVLMAMTAAAWRAKLLNAGKWLLVSTALALTFLVIKSLEYRDEFGHGLRPAATTFLALYFTLTGLHALHVIAGALANLWAWRGARHVGELMTAGRIRAITLYWALVDVVWLGILVLFYLT